MKGKKAIELLVAAIFVTQIYALSHHTCFGGNGRLAVEGMSIAASSRFPHVHPDVATILECKISLGYSTSEAALTSLIDPNTLEFTIESAPVSTRLLVDLACASDYVMYDKRTACNLKSTSLQKLAEMGEEDDCTVVAATLLALNRLESAIRQTSGSYSAGHAPLLKQMISQLDHDQDQAMMVAILKTLLLPSGLNLRNLLWHGFVASNLPRPWLSLVLILTNNLERRLDTFETVMSTYDHETRLLDRMKQPCIRNILTNKRCDSESLDVLKAWLPSSHHDLLKLAFVWKPIRPACSIVLLSVILEHGLRLDWCRLNDSPDNAIAKPGSYYVTLDGHGQKHQHDLILYPFVQSDNDHDACIKNKLIAHLGGTTVALLVDLFVSSTGENLRSNLAHGLFDLQHELMAANVRATDDNSTLVKMADVVVAVMEAAALHPRPALSNYRPMYSYTAETLRNLNTVTKQLQCLALLRDSITIQQRRNDHAATLVVPDYFDTMVTNVLNALDISDKGEWNASHVFEEHEINAALAEFRASRTLLNDVAVATSSFVSMMKDTNDEKDEEHVRLDSRRRRRFEKIHSLSDIVVTMYRFATFVAVLSLCQADCCLLAYTKGLPPEVMRKAVERSRMCVSTFSNFLVVNTERALKASIEYSKGKAIKAVLHATKQ